jgi:hypothetical protein
MAMSASADSDMPARSAKQVNRAFSAAEGRAVIEGAVDRGVRQLIGDSGPGDCVGTRYDRRGPG